MNIREQELLNHIKGLDQDINEYEQTISLLKNKFLEDEKKLNLLVDENEYLKSLLRKKEADCEEHIQEIERLKDKVQRYERENNGLQEAIRELSPYEDRCRQLENRLNDLEPALGNQNNENEQLRNENAELQARIDLLTDAINKQNKELEDMENFCKTAEDRSRAYINETYAQIEEEFRKRLAQEREAQQRAFEHDKEVIEKQIEILRQKIREDENRIALLITENERLNTLNFEEATEIKNLREKIDSNAKEKQRDIDDIKTKIESEINARHNVRVANYEN